MNYQITVAVVLGIQQTEMNKAVQTIIPIPGRKEKR